MIQGKLFDNLDTVIEINTTFEYRQEKLWEAYPEEPLEVYSEHLGTRAYYDGDRVDELRSDMFTGMIVEPSTKPHIIGRYMSHELPPSDDWVQVPSLTGIKLREEDPLLHTVTLHATITQEEVKEDTMFEQSHKHLGILKVGQQTDIVYKYKEDVIAVGRIQSPCGCARVSPNLAEKTITVRYTPKPIPEHLKGQGFYKTHKRFVAILITSDGVEAPHHFSFEAKIIKQ